MSPVRSTAAITIESAFVPLPAALAALTVKVNVSAADGVPEITPAAESVKPPGKLPSLLHVMGASPVAASVWLYAVPTVPPGNAVVVTVGAVPPPPVVPPSEQAVKENPITAVMAIIANSLNMFFI
jgi:hypothetical protein